MGLAPFYEVESRRIFSTVINNADFEWSEIQDVIDKSFVIPCEPVFYVDYENSDERFFEEEIIQNSVLPILASSKVHKIISSNGPK